MTVVASSFKRRAAFALAAGAVLVLPACGAGQISQTATQVAVVSGTHAQAGPLALRDVRVVLPADSAIPGKAARAALAFSLINTSATTPDQLRRVAVAGATATIQPPAQELKPGQTLRAVSLEDQKSISAKAAAGDGHSHSGAAESGGGDTPVSQPYLVELTGIGATVAPGLNVRVTFTFDKAPMVAFDVPVELEQTVPDQPKPAGNPSHH